ncbi:MAG: aminotransferase class III-fold pyridoxal phosphate-dependent enzyme [Alphaproteobacteria bacterium]
MRGAAGRIGFLFPGDGLNDDEYWSYLPDDVAWLTARYPGTLPDEPLNHATFTASANLGPMVAAARVLAEAHPDVIVTGDHAGSFILGVGHDLAQGRAIAQASGARAGSTPSTAIVAALQSLGLNRVAITSPYDAEVTAAGRDFLQGHGIAVVAEARRSFDDETGIAGQEADFWAKAAQAANHPDAQAIVLMGGGLRTGGMIAQLEAVLGKPVIAATAALVWHACQLLAVNPDRPHLGRLFGVTPVRATLSRHLSSGTKALSVTSDPPVFGWGRGTRLYDTAGRGYLDFACGSGTSMLGHGHPAILRALAGQAATGVLHLGPHFHAPVQIALMERLASVLPPALSVFHPATNGSEATEVALKAAIHATGRQRFVGFAGSYHGRTLGALAVSAAKGQNAGLALPPQATHHMRWPENDGDLAALVPLLDAALSPGDIAAIIVEPMQATAGMRVPPAGFLPLLRKAADRHGVVLIMDEVFTGYGRTGTLFAFQHSGVVPDLLILAKAAGGGLPGAMVAGTAALLQGWPAGMQSSTFQMHPLAAAASLATLSTLVAEDLPARAPWIETCLRAASAPIGPLVGTGAMLGLTVLDAQGNPDQPRTKQVRARALAMGLITWECGTAGHVIGLVPPLTVTEAEIAEAAVILIEAFRPAR